MDHTEKINELEKRVKAIENFFVTVIDVACMSELGKPILEIPDEDFPEELPAQFIKSSIRAFKGE